MNCFCNKKDGSRCSGKGVRQVTVAVNKRAKLCTAHNKVFKEQGIDALDLHTQPQPITQVVEPELPFKHTHAEVKAKAADAKEELEKAAANSRVIDTISMGEPGVFPPKQFIIAGTGSRSLQQASTDVKIKAKAIVEAEMEASMANHGDKLIIMSGMAEGFDKLLAYVAIEKGVRLWLAIPNRGYADYYWARHSLTGTNQQAAFDAIVANAERVVYVREDVYHKTTGLRHNGRHYNFLRNDYMVEHGNAFWVWDPTSSGTSDCLESIKRVAKPFRVLSTQL